MAIIGIVGYKGSGKTTACNIIKKHLDDVVQINFKDALVQELKDNFPDLLNAIAIGYRSIHDAHTVPGYEIDNLFNNKPPLVRTLMQNYGTDVRRKEDADHWANKWTDKVGFGLTHCYKVGNILTDDVRFLNEAKAIKEYGGILIRLERTDLEQTDQHQSETEQKEIVCDYTITCGAGDLDKLEAELVKILESLEK